jgi:hypothetical protein
MSFCATSRRLGAETLYPNLTIGGAARETGMLIEKDPLGCQAEKGVLLPESATPTSTSSIAYAYRFVLT